MTKGRWIATVLILGLVGFAAYQGLKPRPPPPVEVQVSTAKKQPITRTVTAAGHLQAHETVKVSSNISGDLLSLPVKEGQQVKKGQVLGQIDRRLQEAQVAQFRAGVANARASIDQISASIAQDRNDLRRTETLVKQNLASDSDLDKAQTLVKVDEGRLAAQKQLVAQNQGQLETALYNLSRATLTAPIDGTILEIQHKVGERIRGSDLSEDVVMLMGGLTEMEVKAEVGEHEVVGIHEGDEATIEIDAIPDKQFKGYVSGLVKNAQIKNPGTDAEVTTFFVRIAFNEAPENGLPGMSSAVSIATATHDKVITVPIQAVTSREAKKKEQKVGPREGTLAAGDKAAPPPAGTNGDAPPTTATTGKPKPVKVVFVVKDGKAEMREVHTGIASRTDIEILDGIKEGEQVVEGPYRTLARELQDGNAVKVQQPKPGPGGAPGPQGGRS
ncbi:MAG: efflux RND transporter periplasmic adaptor subunit [Deltaproteobacteria bacterium]|nr:MAG: efflux RND transporter periplasmic adaptor subunit [Deltaproteobacteria bacterium]